MHALKRTINTKELPIKVMQFGGGNFLRAFVDWMIDILNEEANFNGGIAIIKPTERGDYAQLKSQDGLFTVVLDGIKNGALISEKRLVTAVQKVINPNIEWSAYLALAKNKELRFIVSNTTEAGIKFNAEDTFDDSPPKEFPAKLTVWLHHRFQHFGNDPTKGCIFLPCELIEDNGATLKDCILRYAAHWNLPSDFTNWINTSNFFCNTLVDRIVSGYPDDRAAEIEAELDYKDELLVAGEQYHSWIIQGPEIVQKELPFAKTALNVQFVQNLIPHREMKVRILNGAHTAMVPVAYLAGIRLVGEAMKNTELSHFVASLLSEEASKTLDFSDAIKKTYVADVLDRFRNPLIKHQLISISLNSTSKFVTRLLPTLKDFYSRYQKLPQHIVFSLAALILFYKGESDGTPIDLKDDQTVLDFFAESYQALEKQKITLNEMVVSILGHSALWGEDLSLLPGLAEMVREHITAIQNDGIRRCLKKIN
ncbi:MAG: tagaturonate reductase [Flavobacteriaceae bacterium]